MDTKKLAKAKAITLENLESAFEELKIPKDEAQSYLASHERKVDKKVAKAKHKFTKADTKWGKKMMKDSRVADGHELAQSLIRGL